MKIVLFGGTTEGRRLSEKLAEAGADVTVCVATDYGREEQGELPGVQIRVGPLSPEEKQTLLKDALLCVDATHPYARHISGTVKAACEAAGTEYLRLRRGGSTAEPDVTAEPYVISVPTAATAAEWLSSGEGNILLTTGAKELPEFASLGPERLFPRILPSHQSLDACEALHIPHRNIIAMQGPFTAELNEAMIRQYGIRYLVTKDGGREGGFPEKAAAAKAAGIHLVVIVRPEEDGLSFDAVLNRCISRMRDANNMRDANKEKENRK